MLVLCIPYLVASFWILVWVIFEGHFPVCLLQFRTCGGWWYAQNILTQGQCFKYSGTRLLTVKFSLLHHFITPIISVVIPIKAQCIRQDFRLTFKVKY